MLQPDPLEQKSQLQKLEEAAAAIAEKQKKEAAGPAASHDAAMDALVLVRNNTVKVTLDTPLCRPEPILAQVTNVMYDVQWGDISNAYLLRFVSADLCLNLVDPATNTPIVYWLMKRKPDVDGVIRWELRGARRSSVMTLLANENIRVTKVEKVDIYEPPPDARRSMLDSYRRRVSGMVRWDDPDIVKPDLRLLRSRDPNTGKVRTKVQLSTGETYYIDRENLERIKLQNQIMAKRKPELIRRLPGGAFEGMGIRTPPENEYRREWRSLKVGDRVAVQVGITKPNGDHIARTVLVAKVTARMPQSPLLNAMGTAFALEVSLVRGDEDHVFAFTPMRIGRRRIRYWLCVYDDMYDTKVIAASDSVSHDELVENIKIGDGSLRLAEYAVEDLKLTNEWGDVTPFPGDEGYKAAASATGTTTTTDSKPTTVQTGIRERVRRVMAEQDKRAGESKEDDDDGEEREVVAQRRAPPLQRVRLNASKR